MFGIPNKNVDACYYIVAILDNSGKVVVRYTYDSWGNHDITVLDSSCEQLANLNPFRYRGYYYDTETDLYFLKTRYYDPEIGRFISIDGISYLNPNAINGLNLYAYCNNNPVMAIDPNGDFWLGLFIVTGLLLTAHDIYVLANNSSSGVQATVKNNNAGTAEVEIENGYKVITPWVQWGYSFYLNHIRSDTKDVLKGTTTGVQREWMAHNLGYYALNVVDFFGIKEFTIFGKDYNVEALKKGAQPVNIGATVFDNPKELIGYAMMAFEIFTAPVEAFVDFLVFKDIF